MIDPAKHYFFVEFTLSTCNAEIRVNDIPILRYRQGGSVSTRMFINQFVQNGGNILTVSLHPETSDGFEPTSLCECKVFHMHGANDTLLGELKFAFDHKNPVPAASLSTTFEINELPFAEALWIGNTGELTEKQSLDLYAHFARLSSSFRKGDIEAIMKAGELKDDYFIERYHYHKSERLAYIRKFFSSRMNDSAWKATTYFDNSYRLATYAGGKLYSFELANMDSPIELKNDQKSIKVNIPIFFAFLDNEIKWVL